ncbi:MAG: sulfotransferase [Halobacteriales archaeon]|nr:sulfotransferase [Halobacteriales archaeon]
MSLLRDQRMVFVVGMPRSGTTLLGAMLNAHPDIALPPETHFLAASRAWGWPDRVLRGEELAGYVAALGAYNRIQVIFGERWPGVAEQLLALGEATPADAFACVLRAVAQERGKPIPGEKTPGHLEQVDVLARAFPGARFAAIVRDPRDVSQSWFKASQRSPRAARHFPPDPLYHALRWTWYARLLRRFGEELGPRMLTLRYEDLVAGPEEAALRLCALAGVPHDPAMLAFGGAEQPNFPDRRATLDPLLRSGVSKSRVGAWKAGLAAEHVAVIERVAGREMAAWGYEASDAGDAGAVLRAALASPKRAARFAGSVALWNAKRLAPGGAP